MSAPGRPTAARSRSTPDGRSLYYVDASRSNGLPTAVALEQVSVDGGPATVVLPAVPPGGWDVTDAGIVFVRGSSGPSHGPAVADTLELYTFADGRIRRLGELPFMVTRFGVSRLLIVSRDGEWALVSRIDSWQRDILVADNVR